MSAWWPPVVVIWATAPPHAFVANRFGIPFWSNLLKTIVPLSHRGPCPAARAADDDPSAAAHAATIVSARAVVIGGRCCTVFLLAS
jgi:hypothetical protein